MLNGVSMLSNKTIVIFGSSGNIGPSIVSTVLAFGGKVICVCRNSVNIEIFKKQYDGSKYANNIMYITADAGNDEDISSVIKKGTDKFTKIDGWVNNFNDSIRVSGLNFDRKDVNSELSNLTNVLMATKFAVQYFTDNSIGGSIVNVSSIYGKVSPQPEIYSRNLDYFSPAAYGASKAGMIQFSKYAAIMAADNSVRVNSVVLGPFPTSQVQSDSIFSSKLVSKIPLKRFGKPQEASGTIAFLLGELSSYITGTEIIVDGGWTAV